MLAVLAVAVSFSSYTEPVSAVTAYGSDLIVGRSDGGVDRLGRDLRVRGILAKPSGTGISFVAASPHGIAWLSGPGGAIRDRVAAAKPASQTLTIRSGERTVSVLIEPTSPIRRLSWLAGRVAISYDFGSLFYDLRGAPVSPATFMPADAAPLAANASLWVRLQEDGTELAVFARPYAVRQNALNQKAPLVSLFTAYQVGAWQWAKLGGFASNAFDAFPDGELKITEEGKLAGDAKFMVLSDRVGIAPEGVVAREPESLVNVPLTEQNWEIGRLSAATVPGDSLWFGVGAGSAWWWNGLSLVQQDRKTGASFAYMPWVDDATPTAFAPDQGGLWVGSNRGLRFLDPARPDPKIGFAGFVRAAYGVEATSSTDPSAKKLTEAVFAWRFAEADKAGADGGMMVASIFSVLGLQLPQTASELSKAGSPVLDDLRFGDVIVTSRAAIYLGNGITVELRNGRVQNGEIWAFPRATARRFSP